MKFLFVTVPADSPLQTWYPPLGIAYLSAYLKKFSGWETVCCDAAIGESVMQKIRLEKPDLIGLTSTTLSFSTAIKIARKIKEHFDIPIIVGGTHVSALPHTAPNCFDVVVRGEGEQALLELCVEYEKNGKFTKRVYEAPLIESLDKIPFPDRDIFNMPYYLRPQIHLPGGFGKGVSMLTARGCPFRCVYCYSCRFWREVRFHSLSYAINEIEQLIEKYHVEYINLFDDLFPISKNRLKRFVELFKEHKFDVKFAICGGHAALFDEETAQLFKQMNVEYVSFGLESMSPKILRFLKCGVTTVEQNRAAVRLCKRYGLKMGSGFMYGVPGETEEDRRANMRFVEEEKLDSWSYYLLTPLPGTPLWDYAKAKGLVSDDIDWSRINWIQFGKSVVLNV